MYALIRTYITHIWLIREYIIDVWLIRAYIIGVWLIRKYIIDVSYMRVCEMTRAWNDASIINARYLRVSVDFEFFLRILRICHITHESFRTYECVTSQTLTSHGQNIHVSCRTYKWVPSHTYLSHVPLCAVWTSNSQKYMNWVLSQIWASHGTHINESRPTTHLSRGPTCK